MKDRMIEYPPAPPQEGNLPYYGGLPMMPKIPESPTQDFFLFRLNSDDIISSISHQLKGEIETMTSSGEVKYIQKFSRWANDEGINQILYVVYSCGINKNIILGCLDREQINIKCKSLWIALARLFCTEYSRLGIKKENRSILIRSIVYQIHSALSRSEEGREADQLAVASQRIEHVMHKDNEERGLLSRLNPFKKQ